VYVLVISALPRFGRLSDGAARASWPGTRGSDLAGLREVEHGRENVRLSILSSLRAAITEAAQPSIALEFHAGTLIEKEP
jgi:hypothetical protein